jgi:hypothetical protein
MRLCVGRVRDRLVADGCWDLLDLPPVPVSGASEAELQQLESQLGVALPAEYRAFLRQWRYLHMGAGLQVWGFDHAGVSLGAPWVSDRHQVGVRFLVFADYWGHADGDQLLFDLGASQGAVVAYLHEHGPLFEAFAPSFALALWRMVEEWT